jgi:hypothetical protein
MANPRYNQQVTNRRGAMNGGRMKKMGGGMMKRKMLKKGTEFGMLSVKAGIDKNPKPTQADRIAGAKMKKKNA